MKLEYKVMELDLMYPFGIAREIQYKAENVFTKLTYKSNGKTYVGYGEAHPSNFYGESTGTIIDFYKWVEEEKILETTPYNIAEINQNLAKRGRNYAAKSGIDIALYDLVAKMNNIPAYKYLGFSNKLPKTSYTIDISNIGMTLKKTGDALMTGYDVFKVKLGTPKDEDTIFSVRQAAPDVAIRVDANASWDLKTAMKMVKVLEDNNVEFVEQPLAQNNIKDLKFLREYTTIPLIVDESCMVPDDIIKLNGFVDGINIKLSKCGGITNALKMVNTARACGMKVMVGCFIESSLGIAAASLIASQADYVDLDGCLLLKEDPFNIIEFDKCNMKIKDIPGIAPDNLF